MKNVTPDNDKRSSAKAEATPKARPSSPHFLPPVISTPIHPTLGINSADESTFVFESEIEEIEESNPTVVTINDTEDERLNYTFSMLQTDDSTDDEGEHNFRPPPPQWSLPINRLAVIRKQAEIPAKVIDSFFHSMPEVDLKEIFPSIGTTLLKRRESSMRWNTMINHSGLPRY